MNDQTDTEADPGKPAPMWGWVKAFHPSGLLVTLPVPTDGAAMLCYGTAKAAVDAILAAGFAAHAPGLEAGEEKDTVAYIVRGQSESSRGETTDFLLLYNANDAYRFSFLKTYLNKPEDVAAFEHASSMKLSDFPVYVGQDKPERGKNKQVDKFIVPVRKHFGVVYKQNPKWTQEGADAAKASGAMYTVPRRVFVRWADQKPATGEAGPSSNGKHEPTADEVAAVRQRWKTMLASKPPVDTFNRFASEEWEHVPEGMRENLRKAIDQLAQQSKWEWDGQCYVEAATAGAGSSVPF